MAEYTPQAPVLNEHRAALVGPLSPVDDGSLATTIAAGSDGDALPQATINVADTTGFLTAGTITVTSNGGEQTVTYTGKTGTSFTGCTGGSGVINTGGAVTQATVIFLTRATLGFNPLLYPALLIQCEAAATVKVLGLDKTTWVTYPGASASISAGAIKVIRGRWEALKLTTLGQVWVKAELDASPYNSAL